MRLTCPNCDAHYEVPDEVVPPTGRDVQCSNCGKTWFQHHPDYAPPPEPEFEEDLSPQEPAEDDEVVPTSDEQTTDEPKRRQLDPAIAEILRQEAEIEHEARRRRQLDQSLESQPDLGLEAPAAAPRTEAQPLTSEERTRAEQAKARMASLQGTQDIPEEAVAAAAAISSRRELLPDIDEINSTLRSDTSPSSVSALAREEVGAGGQPRPPGGFRRGFFSVMLIFVVLFLLYLFAPQLADLVPPLEGALAAYVTWVDQMRVSLDAWLRSVVNMLEGMAGQPEV